MSFRLLLVTEGDEVLRADHTLDYLPFGVRTLKLKVEGDCTGKLRLRPAQQVLLRAAAHCDEPCTLSQVKATTDMDEQVLLHHLRWAERHDILYQTDPGRWAFHVPLMQRWIRNR